MFDLQTFLYTLPIPLDISTLRNHGTMIKTKRLICYNLSYRYSSDFQVSPSFQNATGLNLTLTPHQSQWEWRELGWELAIRTQPGIGRAQESWTTVESQGGRGRMHTFYEIVYGGGDLKGKWGAMSLQRVKTVEKVTPQCSPSFENWGPHSRSLGLSNPWDQDQLLQMVMIMTAEKVDASLWVALGTQYSLCQSLHIWHSLRSPVPKLHSYTGPDPALEPVRYLPYLTAFGKQ